MFAGAAEEGLIHEQQADALGGLADFGKEGGRVRVVAQGVLPQLRFLRAVPA